MATIPFTYKYDHMEFTKFVPKLKAELIRSLTIFGQRVSGKGALGLSRHLERSQDYADNNPWWKDAKNKKRVFYDTGFWRTKPSFKILPAGGNIFAAVEVGFVNATAHPETRKSGGVDIQQLATQLSQGATWSPTPRQRQGFWSTMRRRGAKVDPSEIKRKAQYETKPRDFVKNHLKSAKVTALFMTYIDKAVARTYKTTPRKKRSG